MVLPLLAAIAGIGLAIWADSGSRKDYRGKSMSDYGREYQNWRNTCNHMGWNPSTGEPYKSEPRPRSYGIGDMT